MPRFHLLSTPEGIKALQARHPVASIQGPHGFISTEVVFRDARAAHDLHGRLRNLYLTFTVGGDRFATHLRVTRRADDDEDTGPLPSLLTRICQEAEALPLRLRVNLVTAGEKTSHECHGDRHFRLALRADRARWKRHMLGGVEAREWLARAGQLSTLQIRSVEGGWPYAVVDGGPPRLVRWNQWTSHDAPVHPCELCRSVTTDDECWLFTCECSDRYCGGIYSGILVAHDQGLVVWRSPEFPEVSLAVFEQQAYRKVALSAVKRLLREPAPDQGLNWTARISPKWLREALDDARAGRRW